MAPELLAGARYSNAIDVYAYGVLLLECFGLCGRALVVAPGGGGACGTVYPAAAVSAALPGTAPGARLPNRRGMALRMLALVGSSAGSSQGAPRSSVTSPPAQGGAGGAGEEDEAEKLVDAAVLDSVPADLLRLARECVAADPRERPHCAHICDRLFDAFQDDIEVIETVAPAAAAPAAAGAAGAEVESLNAHAAGAAAAAAGPSAALHTPSQGRQRKARAADDLLPADESEGLSRRQHKARTAVVHPDESRSALTAAAPPGQPARKGLLSRWTLPPVAGAAGGEYAASGQQRQVLHAARLSAVLFLIAAVVASDVFWLRRYAALSEPFLAVMLALVAGLAGAGLAAAALAPALLQREPLVAGWAALALVSLGVMFGGLADPFVAHVLVGVCGMVLFKRSLWPLSVERTVRCDLLLSAAFIATHAAAACGAFPAPLPPASAGHRTFVVLSSVIVGVCFRLQVLALTLTPNPNPLPLPSLLA